MVADVILESQPLPALLQLIDHIELPPLARRRGRPYVYPDRLLLKAVTILLVRHLPNVHALLAVLAEQTAEMAQLRAQLTDAQGRFPARRTWERRFVAITETLPALIVWLGAYLLVLLQPWGTGGRAAAIDSTLLGARGGVWHKKHREAGVVPHTSIDTEAGWSKSGWHGWVYGWKLHVVVTVSDTVWLPLAAELTPAPTADNVQALSLVAVLPPQVHVLLGDVHYNDPTLAALCAQEGRLLVTTQRGPYPHDDAGLEVRRLFHQLRSHAIENFNGQFKAIFDCLGHVPTKGLVATRRFVLGAVFLYQLTLLHQHLAGRSLRVGLKPFLLAA
ncbi:MAG: hypothetical protein NVSMB65_15430 [Chloroflexota bacterium]